MKAFYFSVLFCSGWVQDGGFMDLIVFSRVSDGGQLLVTSLLENNNPPHVFHILMNTWDNELLLSSGLESE